MNIIEAIKTNKRIRRIGTKDWLPRVTRENMTHKHAPCISLNYMDILANDWEVEEKKVEVTESQLEEAVFNVFNIKASDYSTHRMKQELGLRD